MTDQQILEDNKLIAEFMGLKTYRDHIDHMNGSVETILCQSPIDSTTQSMQFHSSWDWLMPVAKKIITLCNEEREELFHSDYHKAIWKTIPKADIEDSFRVVVGFITWDNQNR